MVYDTKQWNYIAGKWIIWLLFSMRYCIMGTLKWAGVPGDVNSDHLTDPRDYFVTFVRERQIFVRNRQILSLWRRLQMLRHKPKIFAEEQKLHDSFSFTLPEANCNYTRFTISYLQVYLAVFVAIPTLYMYKHGHQSIYYRIFLWLLIIIVSAYSKSYWHKRYQVDNYPVAIGSGHVYSI